MHRLRTFSVIPGKVISEILSHNHKAVLDLVERTYRQHASGVTCNPLSSFLRFPHAPANRIIALPAAILDGVNACGIKWIASFPENIETGLPRASAVLILNDSETGYPYSCMEASTISAVRTAASAALGAYWINHCRRSLSALGAIGAGLIALRILEFLVQCHWEIRRLWVFDLNENFAHRFCFKARQMGIEKVDVCRSHEELIQKSEMIVFATTASSPYLLDEGVFEHNPRILHISLRDLGPEIVLHANNIVDDVNHSLQANTSLHLAEQRTGRRDFVNGTLVELMDSKCELRHGRTSIFSPFGLGVLDLAVGKYVYDIAVADGRCTTIHDFLLTER